MNDKKYAFPVLTDVRNRAAFELIDTGMALRDYFAGQALIAFMAGQPINWEKLNLQHLAKVAYKISDAMLAEREGSN